MKNRFDVSGKSVIVTGGTKGLGHAIARGFADAGASVALCSRNQVEAGAEAERMSKETGSEVIGFGCDVGKWDQVPAFVDGVYERFGRVDVLVNNAGVNPAPASIFDTSEELFDSVIAVDLKGVLRVSALVAQRMVNQGGGSIINIGSLAGQREVLRMCPYGTAKAGLINLSKSMAAEWSELGVRVNVINPGPFLTPLMLFGETVMPGRIASYDKLTMLRRIGDPEEIVGPCIYLASEASSYVTGEVHDVGGGMR
jgi:gluconate 5-dehydrogenase